MFGDPTASTRRGLHHRLRQEWAGNKGTSVTGNGEQEPEDVRETDRLSPGRASPSLSLRDGQDRSKNHPRSPHHLQDTRAGTRVALVESLGSGVPRKQ